MKRYLATLGAAATIAATLPACGQEDTNNQLRVNSGPTRPDAGIPDTGVLDMANDMRQQMMDVAEDLDLGSVEDSGLDLGEEQDLDMTIADKGTDVSIVAASYEVALSKSEGITQDSEAKYYTPTYGLVYIPEADRVVTQVQSRSGQMKDWIPERAEPIAITSPSGEQITTEELFDGFTCVFPSGQLTYDKITPEENNLPPNNCGSACEVSFKSEQPASVYSDISIDFMFICPDSSLAQVDGVNAQPLEGIAGRYHSTAPFKPSYQLDLGECQIDRIRVIAPSCMAFTTGFTDTYEQYLRVNQVLLPKSQEQVF